MAPTSTATSSAHGGRCDASLMSAGWPSTATARPGTSPRSPCCDPRCEAAPARPNLPRAGSVERCGDGLQVLGQLVELARRQVFVRRCSEIVGQRLDPLFGFPARLTEP